MIKQEIRKPKVQKRHQAIRVKLSGTSEFPRLAVYRSTKHIYAQLIDDEKHVTICSASSVDKDLKEKLAHGGNIDAAKVVGEAIAKKLLRLALNVLYSTEAASFTMVELLLLQMQPEKLV